MSRLFCVTAFRTGECLFYCLTNNARGPRRGVGRRKAQGFVDERTIRLGVPAAGPGKAEGAAVPEQRHGKSFFDRLGQQIFAREAPFSNLPAIRNGKLPRSPFQTPRSFMNGTCRPANARRPPAYFSAGLSPCRNAFRCFPMDGFSCPAAPSSHADAWIPLVKLSNLRYSEKRKNGRRLRAASSFLKAGAG